MDNRCRFVFPDRHGFWGAAHDPLENKVENKAPGLFPVVTDCFEDGEHPD